MPHRRMLLLAMVVATAAALALAAGDAPLGAAGRFGEVRAALALDRPGEGAMLEAAALTRP
ncbi:MAG TPA: hypothetical protein VNI78_01650 [Vicinamibacterales bacterium]|nr:hypothetical protein [Vicinamibacterales bacterium]